MVVKPFECKGVEFGFFCVRSPWEFFTKQRASSPTGRFRETERAVNYGVSPCVQAFVRVPF